MEKHIIYDPDFKELFYYEHKCTSLCTVWGWYKSNPQNILVSLEIDKNDTFEKHISIVKEFMKNIDKYQRIAKAKINAEYSIGEMPIQVGEFIGVFYEKDKFGLQYSDFEEQGLTLVAFFNMNSKFIKTDLSL